MIKPARIQVRFADLDILGHVNNNVYFSYFEMARVHYFKEILGVDWDWKAYGIVIARNEADYVKSILIQHAPEIVVYTESIGTKSFTLSYELMVDGELYAKGRSVQVCFDAYTQKSIAIPSQMIEGLKRIIRE